MQYSILGSDLQALVLELGPGEGVIAEAGAMCWMGEGIDFQARAGDGTDAHTGILGKAFSAAKREVTGAGIFLTHFTNQTNRPAQLSFSAPYPGKILPISVGNRGNELICQKGAFLCATMGTHVDLFFNQKIGAGFLQVTVSYCKNWLVPARFFYMQAASW